MSRPRRFNVPREPNGRIQREHEPAASEVRRLRDAALRGLRDAEWGTELGRMYLEGTITATQYAAGKKWHAEAAKYRESIGAHPARSVRLERASYGTNPEQSKDEITRDENARERYFEAHAVLTSAGPGAEAAVRILCEDDEAMAGMVQLLLVRQGLSRLAVHYRLDNQR